MNDTLITIDSNISAAGELVETQYCQKKKNHCKEIQNDDDDDDEEEDKFIK